MVRFPDDPKCAPQNDGEKPEKEQGRPKRSAKIGKPTFAEKQKQRHRQPCDGEAWDQEPGFHHFLTVPSDV